MNATGSFVKFLLGFLVFLAVSFGVTAGVQKYETANSGEEQAAAALRAMIERR